MMMDNQDQDTDPDHSHHTPGHHATFLRMPASGRVGAVNSDFFCCTTEYNHWVVDLEESAGPSGEGGRGGWPEMGLI